MSVGSEHVQERLSTERFFSPTPETNPMSSSVRGLSAAISTSVAVKKYAAARLCAISRRLAEVLATTLHHRRLVEPWARSLLTLSRGASAGCLRATTLSLAP